MERKLKESERAQVKLQTENLRLSLNPQGSSSLGGAGVTAFDVARAQREAEKVLTLQKRVQEAEDRERQAAVVHGKMEALLRDHEAAVQERAAAATAAEALAAELRAQLIERDEKLRARDSEALRLHELQMEEKDKAIAQLEQRLGVGDSSDARVAQLRESLQRLTEELETAQLQRDQARQAAESQVAGRMQALHAEAFHLKLALDQATVTGSGAAEASRELRAESEQVHVAIALLEPKVRVLESMLADAMNLVHRREARVAHLSQQLQRLGQELENRTQFFHRQAEDMKKGLMQRDARIRALEGDVENKDTEAKERGGRVPDLEQQLKQTKEQLNSVTEEAFRKEARLQALQDTLDHMQFAVDKSHGAIGERDARVSMLQQSLDQTQPAIGIARRAIVAPPPPPPSRTKWTRLVHPSVLIIGHVSSRQERDMKIDAFQVLLRLGEPQVPENMQGLADAAAPVPPPPLVLSGHAASLTPY